MSGKQIRIAASTLFTVGLILAGGAIMGRANSGSGSRGRGATLAEAASVVSIGGEPVVTLKRPQPADKTKPQFLQATILPGMGMNVLALKAYVPGKGDVDVLATKSLEDAKNFLEQQNDKWSNNSFKLGGAILLPYPNRITGTLSADQQIIETMIEGHRVSLPANWADKGDRTKGVIHAMHGLILSAKFHGVKAANGAAESTVSASYDAGNFGGHWLSKTDVHISMALRNDALDIWVTTKNAGDEVLPMAIGWHPYFNFPSGNRSQVRLHVPGTERVLVNNYSDVFPTGKMQAVKGTPYDFTAPGGAALGKDLYLDDCWTDLERTKAGNVEIRVVDPAAKYGVRILGLSPHIKAIQVYSPPDQTFAAIEPQFNLADPYNKKIWGSRDTGIVSVQPGQSVTWHVRVELFTPGK